MKCLKYKIANHQITKEKVLIKIAKDFLAIIEARSVYGRERNVSLFLVDHWEESGFFSCFLFDFFLFLVLMMMCLCRVVA